VSALHFDVVGAEGPRTFFARVTKATIGHAYLFSGAPGVGKKTFARRLAQSLLCEAPHETVLGYDGTCGSCKLFEAGDATRHPDFLEHTGALKIGDADSASGFYGEEGLSARDIVRQLSLESYSGGMRVLLLGDIEFATHHAANALLKFFEEPPDDVVLLLTTPTPDRLLTTIRSRLVDVRFPALSNVALREILMRAGYGEKEAELGASLGAGSATRAIAALSGEEDSLRPQVAAWFFDVIAGGTPEEAWATRDTLDDGLEVIKTLARDWVALGIAGPSAPPIAPDYKAEIERLPPLADGDAIAVLNKIEDAQRLARTNVSPVMVSELVRMALTNKARPLDSAR
jgi:DNA polymerase III delta prime subunit